MKLFFLLTLAMPLVSQAKDAPPKLRAQAAEAWDRGTSEYLAGHYAAAAHWFETAYRLAPSATALIQAIRAHQEAKQILRAANLALRLRDRYAKEKMARTISAHAIRTAKQRYGIIEAECDSPCTLDIDGALLEHPSRFVEPNRTHVVTGVFFNGRVEEAVSVKKGKRVKITLQQPVEEKPSANAERNKRIPRWAFYTSAATTLALGAIATWSHIDAGSRANEYERAAKQASLPGASEEEKARARALLKSGQKRERQAWILTGLAGGSTVGTVVLGLFTNWQPSATKERGKRGPTLQPSISFGQRGAKFALKGRF